MESDDFHSVGSEQSCDMLYERNISNVLVVGDSLARHVYQGMMLVLTGNADHAFWGKQRCKRGPAFYLPVCRGGNQHSLKHVTQNGADVSEPAVNTVNANSSANVESAFEQQEDLTLNLEQIEKRAITQALRTYRYNISHTAKALGLTRAALYRRMEKHGL
jgi:ActR/RegA family two-component response regulator